MDKNTAVWTVALILMCMAVLSVVALHGRANRVFAPGSTAVTVHSPEEALRVWEEKQVKGRILLLFDYYPHARGLANYPGRVPVLSDSNLVEFGIFRNIIRKVYLVVPEEEWDQFIAQKEVRPLRQATESMKSDYLYYRSGVPLIAVTPSSLPPISEKVLVYVNEAAFDVQKATGLISQKKVATDVIITRSDHKQG